MERCVIEQRDFLFIPVCVLHWTISLQNAAKHLIIVHGNSSLCESDLSALSTSHTFTTTAAVGARSPLLLACERVCVCVRSFEISIVYTLRVLLMGWGWNNILETQLIRSHCSRADRVMVAPLYRKQRRTSTINQRQTHFGSIMI